ncbi:MAG: hypothetical protein Q9170_006110 [Blastenia crenularia]
MAPVGIAIVGLGRRTFRKALVTISSNPEKWRLIAATDSMESARESFKALFANVPVFQNVEDMLGWNDHGSHGLPHPIEAAYVAIPHHCYALVVPALLSAGIHLLKEKPAAMTLEELLLFQDLAETNHTILSTAGQRRYGHAMARMKHWVPLIGEIYSLDAKLKICVPNLDEGWRANSALAGGGAMADVGWHLLDVVIELLNLGQENPITVAYARLFHVRSSRGHDCEDSAKVILEFPSTANKPNAHLNVSRVGHREEEEIVITAAKGVLVYDGIEVCVHFEPSASMERLRYNPSQAADYQTDFQIMFIDFYEHVRAAKQGNLLDIQDQYIARRTQDLVVTRTLQAIYRHASNQMAERELAKMDEYCVQDQSLPLTMEWPKMDWVIEQAVVRQLHEDISIYGNGGVFKRFETEWKEHHGVSSSYALLHSSGTNALHALYFAAGLMPGDEVIFPVYTFHATCSPAMHFGIKPVFCDATENGTIDPSAIARVMTARTKAVVITHMWGIPCDMAAIFSALKLWPRVLLFEDCSHAHGAKFNGQPVGTFGDGAAWSLQGQKIITGGEGGITVTKHPEFHYRQLIFGHYNKRCKLEIPSDHHLSQFALTGAGFKNRAHPLAIAVALTQLRQLAAFHYWKTKYAKQLIAELSHIPFLDLPAWDLEHDTEPAWYAFVMRFKAAKAPHGLTRELFVAELYSKGLVDVDIPRSTGLLHREPLYNKPQDLLPHVYSEDYAVADEGASFDEAQAFYDEAMKLPVYATADGQAATNRYAKAIIEVASTCMQEQKND